MTRRAHDWVRRHPVAAWAVGLAAVTAAALVWRLLLALRVAALPDERICIGLAEEVLRPGGAWPLHGGDHPLLGIYLLAGSGWLFGNSLTGYRMLGVLAGGLTPLVVALAVARSGPRREALLAAALLAASPLHAGLSALAFEIPFQLLFITLAWWRLAGLPGGGRSDLVAGAALLGLAFLCSESAALLALGWGLVLLLRPERRLGLVRRDFVMAGAAFFAVIAVDVAYNLSAARPDFRYVNYLDHAGRIARPTLSLHGLGFFLRDAFGATLSQWPALWTDHRCEYPGPGIALGILLLLGALHALAPDGDPAYGLWSVPPLLLVLVTTFLGPAGPGGLDAPVWTWPLPSLPLLCAATAHMIALRWTRGRSIFVALLLASVLPAPDVPVACD